MSTWQVWAFLVGSAAIILYFFDPDQYTFYPRCPFRWLTGWQCPVCGSTHAAHYLLHGDWARAWHCNALFVATIPMALLGFLSWTDTFAKLSKFRKR